jgi:hypothetical protein
MKITAYCAKYVSGTYSVKELLGEISEFLEDRNMDELGDIAIGAQILLHELTGFNWNIHFGKNTVLKQMHRRKLWLKVFKQNGLAFNPRFLIFGSNCSNQDKVDKTLAHAKSCLKIDLNKAPGASLEPPPFGECDERDS